MKKLLSLLLAAIFALSLCAFAGAEDGTVSTETVEFIDLPYDFSPGLPADPARFTADGYEDESISVTMERVWVDKAHFNVAHVKIQSGSQLRTALAAPFGKKNTNKISTLARNNNAVLAIGGDYYLKYDKGYVVRQGEVYRKSPYKERDMLCIDKAGDFHILINGDAEELKALVTDEATAPVNVFNFGPALVKDGEKLTLPGKYFLKLTSAEPRCAIGQIGPLEYLLVLVDGGIDRQVTITNPDGTKQKSIGCDIETLAQFMYDRGCVQAYNLDGGNSALMVLGTENYSKKTVEAERALSDIIYFSTAVRFGGND